MSSKSGWLRSLRIFSCRSSIRLSPSRSWRIRSSRLYASIRASCSCNLSLTYCLSASCLARPVEPSLMSSTTRLSRLSNLYRTNCLSALELCAARRRIRSARLTMRSKSFSKVATRSSLKLFRSLLCFFAMIQSMTSDGKMNTCP